MCADCSLVRFSKISGSKRHKCLKCFSVVFICRLLPVWCSVVTPLFGRAELLSWHFSVPRRLFWRFFWVKFADDLSLLLSNQFVPALWCRCWLFVYTEEWWDLIYCSQIPLSKSGCTSRAAEPKYNPKCSEQGKGSPPFFLFALFSPASLSPLSPSRIVAVFSEQVYLQTGGQVFFLLLFWVFCWGTGFL